MRLSILSMFLSSGSPMDWKPRRTMQLRPRVDHQQAETSPCLSRMTNWMPKMSEYMTVPLLRSAYRA